MRALLLAVALLAVVPASSQAAFEVRSFTVTPSGLQAGSHPDARCSSSRASRCARRTAA
jgi:hypothetical protein